MSERESIIEAKGRLTGEKLIEEIKAGACEKQLLWENAEAKSKGDQETKKISPKMHKIFGVFLIRFPQRIIPSLTRRKN